MGPTGARWEVSSSVPGLISRIRKLAVGADGRAIPMVVGFGISTAAQFEYVGRLADGAVVGSKLMEVVKSTGIPMEALTRFCEEICGRRRLAASLPPMISLLPKFSGERDVGMGRFGVFGGRYVPEAFIGCLVELEACHRQAMADPAFRAELEVHYEHINRPSQLYFAQRLSAHVGGAKIWFKREDLIHTGSHTINNIIGQILLAKRMRKTRIIAECATAHYGFAIVSLCTKFALDCVLYIGEEDLRRCPDFLLKIEELGASVVTVSNGDKKLKDAIR